MKLIRENFEEVRPLTEEVEGKKKVYIEGIFAQSEVENRNKRIYPKSVMEAAIGKYIIDYVNTGRGWGELEHPETPRINPENICHRITELKWSGNDVLGKALVLNEGKGKIVLGMIEAEGKFGVSTRALGSLEKKGGKTYVKEDLMFNAVDVVMDPSAPSAFVDGIMEGVEYFYEGTELVVKKIEQIKERIHKTPKKDLTEAKIREFQEFMNWIKL